MSLADSILLPHTPEVLAAKRQKRIYDFEEMYPGLIEKTKAWLNEEYARLKPEKGFRWRQVFYYGGVPLKLMEMMWNLVHAEAWNTIIMDMARMLWREHGKC